MTLHKSKGLEFDTVILPALDRRSRADGTQLLNWFESTLDGSSQLLIAPFEASGIDAHRRDRINKLVQRAKDRCDDHEKLRLLYVACTRAKRHLHLLARSSFNADKGEVRVPVAASLLAPLWPLLKAQFAVAAVDVCSSDDALPYSLTDANDSAKVPSFRRLPLDATLPPFVPFQWQSSDAVKEDQDRQALEFQWAGRDARDIGTVVHEQLQMLADASPPLPGDDNVWARQSIIRRQLKNLGVNDSSIDNAVNRVVTALSNTLSDERGRWILEPHKEAQSEWAISVLAETEGRKSANQVVIDRTFVDADGTRWIVDYKTGDHEGGDVQAFLDQEQKRYASQLDRYANIIRRMDDRPVKVGLYFPMLKGWREWVPDALLMME